MGGHRCKWKSCLVLSNRRAIVAKFAKQVHAGHDIKMSEHTVYYRLLSMGLCCCRLFRVPMLTSVCHLKRLQWARSIKAKRWSSLISHIFSFPEHMCFTYPGRRWHQKHYEKAVWCSGHSFFIYEDDTSTWNTYLNTVALPPDYCDLPHSERSTGTA